MTRRKPVRKLKSFVAVGYDSHDLGVISAPNKAAAESLAKRKFGWQFAFIEPMTGTIRRK